MSAYYGVQCDRCGAIGDESTRSVTAARVTLKRNGWEVNKPGAKDYCPNCHTPSLEEVKKTRKKR